MIVERKLAEMGIALPGPIVVPPGVSVPFEWIRASGGRAYLSGHSALNPDGTMPPVFGKVGRDVSYEEAHRFARGTAVAMLATIRREIGDLDRIRAWIAIHGYVNALPGESRTTHVINGCSELILELFGPDVGRHARTAIGVEALPQNLPLVISAQIEFE
ncbi:RidA family protein [Paenibacillus sp.]|uniref:RidA family protein n=1 Tax=Paenibacillus sp. TaxID=58172 RepID=UPI002D509C0B|nr:RidA family protein [Paenibacillus sp.]HZG84776.1 RidA family protein [Paenibacillus sp.]